MRFETRDLMVSGFTMQDADPENVRRAGDDCPPPTRPTTCGPQACSEGGTNDTCGPPNCTLGRTPDPCRPDGCTDGGTHDDGVLCNATSACTEGGTGPEPCIVTEEDVSSAGSLRLDSATLSEALTRQLGGVLNMR